MQINQRFVRPKYSRAQVALSDRDVSDKKYLVREGLHACPCACFLEERVELPQVHIIKSRWSRLDCPGTADIEQYGTDRHATRNHRDKICGRKFLPFDRVCIGKRHVSFPI